MFNAPRNAFPGGPVAIRTEAMFLSLAAAAPVVTPAGPRPAGCLDRGDVVLTRDHGPRPVLWAGRRTVSALGDHAPVRVTAGALGNGQDVLVAPGAALAVSDWRSDLLFGRDCVLADARDLADGARILRAPCPTVTYAQVLFAGTELVALGDRAEDALWVECRLPGIATLVTLDRATRDALLALAPDSDTIIGGGMAARPRLTQIETAVLRAAA